MTDPINTLHCVTNHHTKFGRRRPMGVVRGPINFGDAGTPPRRMGAYLISQITLLPHIGLCNHRYWLLSQAKPYMSVGRSFVVFWHATQDRVSPTRLTSPDADRAARSANTRSSVNDVVMTQEPCVLISEGYRRRLVASWKFPW